MIVFTLSTEQKSGSSLLIEFVLFSSVSSSQALGYKTILLAVKSTESNSVLKLVIKLYY